MRQRPFSWVCVWLVLCIAGGGAAAATPPRFEKPDEVVAWLYRDFGWQLFIEHYFDKDLLIDQPEASLARYFTATVAHRLAVERQGELRRHDVGPINFDLLFGTQDPTGLNNLRISRVPNTDTVVVVYDQFGHVERMKMSFNTVRTPQGWRIADIRYELRKTADNSEATFSLLGQLGNGK